MNKDPAFLFYPSDFLVGTMLMTNEEVGKYIRLLCLAHSKNGYLTKQDMFKICNTDDIYVLNKFNVDDEGIYYNERLLSEISKRKKYSDSRSTNRKGKKAENIKHMNDISNSYDSHMENENINEIINNNSIKSLSIKEDNKKEDKPKSKRETFVKPSLDEIRDYISENLFKVDAEQFYDYYSANGWLVGKAKMKDWKASVRTWNRNSKKNQPRQYNNNQGTQSKTGSRALDMLLEMEKDN